MLRISLKSFFKFDDFESFTVTSLHVIVNFTKKCNMLKLNAKRRNTLKWPNLLKFFRNGYL